jgi:hypothetical protein
LRVIYVPDPEPNSMFVITAYELTGKPPPQVELKWISSTSWSLINSLGRFLARQR